MSILDRLRHGGAVAPKRAGSAPYSRRRRLQLVGGREVDRRGEQFEHHFARRPHARRVGVNLHARFGLARARRRQHARALDLDDAHAAGVDGRQRLEIAERRDILARRAARIENRRALGDLQRLAVDRELNRGARRARRRLRNDRATAAEA